jgi:lipoprotein NlpI
MKTFAILLLFLGAAAASAQTAPELLEQAAAALKAGKNEDALALATRAIAKDPKNVEAWIFRGTVHEAMDRYKNAVADFSAVVALDPKDASAWQRRGVAHFKAGQIDASIRDFDKFIELRPAQKVSHWQRGISYYYAGRYDDGRQQFEGYQDFDSNDVENAVWRLMCMAKKDGMAKARKGILKIGDDRRVPMRQVYDLFKGDLKPDDVLAAARAGNPPKEQLNQRLFYAYHYVGIYYDLAGDRKKALADMEQAVAHRICHYMWDVARIHRDLLAKKVGKGERDVHGTNHSSSRMAFMHSSTERSSKMPSHSFPE